MAEAEEKRKLTVYILSDISFLSKCFENSNPAEDELKFISLEAPEECEKLTQDLLTELQCAEVMVIDNEWLGPLLYALPNLKWAQCTSSDIGALKQFYDPNEQPFDFKVSLFKSTRFGEILSEYVMAMMIIWERRMVTPILNQSEKKWIKPFLSYRLLSELTVSILGTGKVGCEIAKTLRTRNAEVWGYSDRKHQAATLSNFDQFTNDVYEILPETSYIINTLPDNPKTANLLTSELLSQCIMCPVLINVGRGSIISDSELISALDNDYLSGAILDVFTEEPLCPKSVLWDHPKIIITPHVATTQRTMDIMALFYENYELYKANKKLVNEVSKWD